MGAEGKKAASRAGNYQDAATASLDRDIDNDATTQDDGEGDQAVQANPAASGRAVEPDHSISILSSVEKVIPVNHVIVMDLD